ncbi:MAG: Rid family detoxifying hydrolase [Actinomycetota bacterium]|nr:Rid family detoxifying hydrolase [Acidimicrobiales bacterium]MEC8922032.1 Rid family detoxifying hydrolase [Actinomycetota bacterium]MED5552183.1 Rid family detoxifying hydrolase [Actinomycetota bacterium]MEE2680170.1 Rid family detoxifying hydrolase [Actinomycetota bacterium]MEE3139882.1 Rid family detoxifying hydrolase [Actinomycetota bacterium]
MSKPVAHYSASYRAGDLLFVSGQVGIADGSLVEGVQNQTLQALNNVQAVLGQSDLTLEHVVKCTVFMTDIDNFAVVNATYAEVFGDHRPSRSAVAVKALPLGALVEIEAIAHTSS